MLFGHCPGSTISFQQVALVRQYQEERNESFGHGCPQQQSALRRCVVAGDVAKKCQGVVENVCGCVCEIWVSTHKRGVGFGEYQVGVLPMGSNGLNDTGSYECIYLGGSSVEQKWETTNDGAVELGYVLYNDGRFEFVESGRSQAFRFALDVNGEGHCWMWETWVGLGVWSA